MLHDDAIIGAAQHHYYVHCCCVHSCCTYSVGWLMLVVATGAVEAKYFGIDVAALLQKGKGLHLSEYGVGGGKCGDTTASCVATTPDDAAATPGWGCGQFR